MSRNVLLVGFLILGADAANSRSDQQVPVATQWTLDAAGPTQRNAIRSVLMIICPTSGSKGTGFLLTEGVVATAEHVVHGCGLADLIGINPSGSQIRFAKIVSDAERDLALLRPAAALPGGLELANKAEPEVGTAVSTWGFPLGYNGPSPLLSVGYLSGFAAPSTSTGTVKHLVVNGAFNPGNSGGPLFQAGDDKVIGIVVSKHAPMTPFVASALEVLAKNHSGVIFEGTDAQGAKKQFVESQIVAEILQFYRSLTQVMIGEAVAVRELREFLAKNKGKI